MNIQEMMDMWMDMAISAINTGDHRWARYCVDQAKKLK